MVTRTTTRNIQSESEGISMDELTRKAYQEIMSETKRGSIIANEVGPQGWKKRETRPNKRFLQRTLIGSLSSNTRQERTVHHSRAPPEDADRRSSKKRKKDTYNKLTKNIQNSNCKISEPLNHSLESTDDKTAGDHRTKNTTQKSHKI